MKKVLYTEPQTVNILGMELDEWWHKSCSAHVATGKDWATIYDIQSVQEGQGHATKLLLVMKAYYEQQGKIFGGSVALNKRMAWLYKKCEIKEYTEVAASEEFSLSGQWEARVTGPAMK